MIHRVYSDLPGFKNLDFKSGLNVILAQKSKGATSKQTRNRAGKTSLIEIVHFLGGANVGPSDLLRTKELVDFTFSLDFDLSGSRINAHRRGANKAKIRVEGYKFGQTKSQLTNSEWLALLGKQVFGIDSSSKEESRKPSFRSVFPYFVRRQLNNAFITPEKHSSDQQMGDAQIALMFLLGLDWKIASDWQKIRDQEKNLKELKKAAGLGTLGSIIGKAADLRTECTLAEARLKKLQDQLQNFRVLPEYHELEVEASSQTQELNDLANANTIDMAAIKDIELALTSEAPPSLDDLKNIYHESGIVLPDLVKKRYDDVRSFHESVIRNRRDYLGGELEAAKIRIESRNRNKAILDARRARVMEILKSHGALDQFSKLQSELGRKEAEAESLQRRYEAAEKLEGTKNELEIERNRLELRLRRDFFEQKNRLVEGILAFEEISRQLYESAGSMVVSDTANGPVFSFPMQGSRSKGIKNMQIFCFDMMLMRLCAERGIGPGFLIHDSHLFDGVDGRQIIRALRVGAETAKEFDFQYIVTLNQDDAFKEIEEGFDLTEYLLPVRLTDATEEGGLFGIRFD